MCCRSYRYCEWTFVEPISLLAPQKTFCKVRLAKELRIIMDSWMSRFCRNLDIHLIGA